MNNIPLTIGEYEAYYWMDDHIEVGPTHFEGDHPNPRMYSNKHSFCPSEVHDPNLETPFGYWSFSNIASEDFHRLKPEEVNPQFRATLLLLGIYA